MGRLKDKKSRRGAALIMVLLLLAIVSVLLAEFAFERQIHTRLLKNHEAKIKARYVARAGQNAANGLIMRTRPDNQAIFNNPYVQLFNYECMGTSTASTGGTTISKQAMAPINSIGGDHGPFIADPSDTSLPTTLKTPGTRCPMLPPRPACRRRSL